MLELVALRDRPDLLEQVFSDRIQSLWPEYLQNDPVAGLYYVQPHLDAYLDTAFAVIDIAKPGVAVGRAFAVPFAFGYLPERSELPDTGWDGVVRWAHRDRMSTAETNCAR
jgi:hypothetical protein